MTLAAVLVLAPGHRGGSGRTGDRDGGSAASFEYRQSGDARYLADGLRRGRSNSWSILVPPREQDPDIVKAGETYYDLNAIDPSASLTAIDSRMAQDLTGLPLSQYDWADALFMGLPNWTRAAARTGNSAYLDKMDALFAWRRDEGATSSRCSGRSVPQNGLFDATRGLWYREGTFVGVSDKNGKPVFWGRGSTPFGASPARGRARGT